MRRLRRRMTAVLTALLLLTLLIPWGLAEPAPGPHQTTVLFTHDLHSHFLPLERADGGESGGYARLASALEQQRALHPDALTLDGGDFSIGSLVQTLYTTRAAELRTMGALGYDATTAGNHEFDHTGLGFAQMLTAAYTSGDPLPALLMANYAPSAGGPDQLDIQRAMSAYGVTDTLLLERGGVTYGIFGLMGTDSDDCAPTSGFTLEDPVQAAEVGGPAAGQGGGGDRPDPLRPYPHHPHPAHCGGGYLYRLRRALLRESGEHHSGVVGGRKQDPGGLPADPYRRDPAGGPGDRLPGGGVEGPGGGGLSGPLPPDL